MTMDLQVAQANLKRFDLRNSEGGRFRRYAQGALLHFPARFGVMAATALFIATGLGVGHALLMLVIATTGELTNNLVLRQMFPDIGQHLSRRTRFKASAAAAFQATTFAVCVIAFWILSGDSGVRFLAVIGLVWMAINAGLLLPYFHAGNMIRLGINLGSVVGLLFYDFMWAEFTGTDFAYDVAATLIYLTMAMNLLRQRIRFFHRKIRAERTTLRERVALERSRDALRLKEHQARKLAAVAENARDIVVISDKEGAVEWVNDAFTRMFGYRCEDVVGKGLGILNGPKTDPETVRGIAQARRKGVAFRAEILNYTRDGREVWIETHLTPVTDTTGKIAGFISVERDIAAIKRRESELADARRAAESTAAAHKRFLATMSHEFRTPMNGVVGTAELLLASNLDPRQRELAQTIADSCEALLTIANDTLDMSRLEAGKIELHSDPFDLRRCVASTVELLHPLSAEKGIGLSYDCSPNLPEIVTGDKGRLRQILLNLVGNAVKFTPVGEVHVAVTATEAAETTSVSFAVRDSGIGIPADQIDHIFEAFAQVETGAPSSYGGTGLGLNISKRLAAAMGGSLVASSVVGQGSCFTLCVDFAKSDSPQATLPGAVAVTAVEGRYEGFDILIADDNKTNRFLLSRLLEKTGATLRYAENGEQAVLRYAERRPDIILMDVSMPERDGMQATRDIREIEFEQGARPVPIIALTADTTDSARENCTAAGMDGFLSKPIRQQDLLTMLTPYLHASAENSPVPCRSDSLLPALTQEGATHGRYRDPGLQSQLED